MNVSVFIATSLDGFIARVNGDIDWLPHDPTKDAEDYGYAAFAASVDFIVMGRHTYEKVVTFDPWPYKQPVVVLTTRPLETPETLAAVVESMAGTPEDVVARLDERGARHLYVDGGITVQRFLAAGLVDRLIITRLPILLGSGIPLFGPLPADVPWTHVATRSYPNGLVQSEYVTVR